MSCHAHEVRQGLLFPPQLLQSDETGQKFATERRFAGGKAMRGRKPVGARPVPAIGIRKQIARHQPLFRPPADGIQLGFPRRSVFESRKRLRQRPALAPVADHGIAHRRSPAQGRRQAGIEGGAVAPEADQCTRGVGRSHVTA